MFRKRIVNAVYSSEKTHLNFQSFAGNKNLPGPLSITIPQLLLYGYNCQISV